MSDKKATQDKTLGELLADNRAAHSKSRLKRVEVQSREKRPSIQTLSRWSDDGVAEATDGCRVEPDGTCEHGSKSWLLVLGLI